MWKILTAFVLLYAGLVYAAQFEAGRTILMLVMQQTNG